MNENLLEALEVLEAKCQELDFDGAADAVKGAKIILSRNEARNVAKIIAGPNQILETVILTILVGILVLGQMIKANS